MEIYFFTAVDENPDYRREADILQASGRAYGRQIHRHEIPACQRWNRYKVDLLLTDLPAADRYVYLDSDTVLTGPGDWEADDCQGVADVLYYMDEPHRLKHTAGFMRNHTTCIGDGPAWDYVAALWHEQHEPIWCNSGVVVLDAAIRRPFCRLWKDRLTDIDGHCARGFVEGDEYALCFARAEFGLPLLPPRFNGMCKWQPIYPWHVLIHADGNVGWPKRQPYTAAVAALNLSDRKETPCASSLSAAPASSAATAAIT